MAKIPFSIKFRPQIESGEYKVETNDGHAARIICWDSPIDKDRPIIAIVFDDQIEQYKADGRYDNDYETSNYDLFIVTPEPEMTEFEKAVDAIYKSCNVKELRVKDKAAELLALAREELFANDTVLKEYAEEARKQGKDEALKDLPRWKKCNLLNTGQTTVVIGYTKDEDMLYRNGKVISLLDLEKLPGFKEDER